MSLRPYAEYKDSGVAWLGEVPAHWQVLQSRRMFAVRSEPARATDKMLTASQKYGVLYQSDFVEREGRRVVEVILGVENLKHVEPDDFIISMRSFQGGIEWCRLEGSTSFHYVMLKPIKHVVPVFFSYLLKSQPYIQALRRTTDLIRDGQELRFSNFAQVPLPAIPEDEQYAIADFLEYETSKIDALIAEQEKLIALLTEKRQAVISHAVTKGLNPDAPMKDSGIAWLGEVPAHWTVTRLKFVATVQTGIAKGKDNQGRETISVPYLRVANVQDGFLALDDISTIEIEPEQLNRYRLQPGDVLMNEGGDFDKLGRGAVWHGEIEDCIHQNHVFAVRPHSIEAAWLNQITSSQYAQFYFMSRSKQSTNLASISSSNIMELPILMPPSDERDEIVAFVKAEQARLDALSIEAEQAINLLKERRSALISAAVTGKIDVRNWQPEASAA
ncbi:hypothetical protein AAFM71_07400 [Chromobacterium violaceum]|uniref:restriction endonuclease subunit S n=1 Tax=Chromobacterium violaceum TaxID=536 RepID=UPI00385A495A